MTILRHQICKVAVNAGLVIAATVFVSGSTMAADDPRTDLLLTEARSLVDLIRRIDHRSAGKRGVAGGRADGRLSAEWCGRQRP